MACSTMFVTILWQRRAVSINKKTIYPRILNVNNGVKDAEMMLNFTVISSIQLLHDT